MMDQLIQLALQATNEGRFWRALMLLDKLSGAAGGKQQSLLRLKCYNRLQWLPEAKDIVSRANTNELISDENFLLECAFYHLLCGNTVEAERYFKQVLHEFPRNVLAASELAILYEQRGETSKALQIYRKIIAAAARRKKLDEVVLRIGSRLAGVEALDTDELDFFQREFERQPAPTRKASISFVLARHFSQVGDAESELSYLTLANKLGDSSYQGDRSWSSEILEKKQESLYSLFDKPRPSWLPDFEPGKMRVLVVLGMPRSGTTLLEQILGAHPQVGNCGESRALGVALNRLSAKISNQSQQQLEKIQHELPYFSYLKLLEAGDCDRIIDYYQNYQSLLTTAPVVTDKELSNIYRVGLIAALFPDAKFVAIQRHPLDVCASIMQHDLSGAAYSTSAINCIREYEAYYRLVSFWHQLFPDRFLRMRYENLVSDLEATSRSLLTQLGLGWSNDILNFYRRQNSVRTPSLTQVRRGIHQNAVEKWRRYEPILGEAIEYYQSHMEPYGAPDKV